MKVRSIWNNVYTLKKEKPKKVFCIFLVIVFCIWISLAMKLEFQKQKTYEGIYSCNKICTITAIMPLKDAKELNQEMKFYLNGEIYPLKAKEWKPIEYLEKENLPIETIVFEIPKLNYYEKQTIDFQILTKKESLWKIVMNYLRGGE